MIIYDDPPEYGRIISYPPSEALAAMVEEDKRLVREAVTCVTAFTAVSHITDACLKARDGREQGDYKSQEGGR